MSGRVRSREDQSCRSMPDRLIVPGIRGSHQEPNDRPTFRTDCRPKRRRSPYRHHSSTAAGRIAAPRTGSPTRSESCWPGRLTSSPPTARPRSASRACSGCLRAPSARSGPQSWPTAPRGARPSRSIPRRTRRVARRLRPGWTPRHPVPALAGRRRAAPRSRSSSAAPPTTRLAHRSTRWRRREPPAAQTGTYAVLPIPTAGDVALGFEFARAADAESLGARLPPTMARHAAVALALITSQLADERELATLRARDAERNTFVSTVAHELRTPLTGLRGYLELILGGQVLRRGHRARLPRTKPDDRGLDGRPGRRPARAVTPRVGHGQPRDRTVLGRRSGQPGRREPAADRDRSRRAPDDVAAAAAADRARRPPTRRADPHEPRRECPQVHAGGRKRRDRRRSRRASVAIFVVRDDGRGIPADDRGADLRAVPADGRPRTRRRDGSRPADRPRPRQADGRRPGRRVRPRAPDRRSS